MNSNNKPTFEIKETTPSIQSFLMNGIYEIDMDSATGKTWLTNLLRKYSGYGYNCFGISYNDILNINKIGIQTNFPENMRSGLIMIDRYDMFRGKFDNKIINLSKYNSIMIDTKNGFYGTDSCGYCTIEMNPLYFIIRSN